MIEIVAVKALNKIEAFKFEELLLCLGKEKQPKIKKFLRWEDSQRGLIADILIRTLICKKLKIKNSEIAFDKNEFGKPSLAGNSNLHFNASHSGEWVVCAIDEYPIGVDVETIKPISFDIADRFFSREECRSLMMKNEAERLAAFYDFWTLKESYMKADGRGMSIPLDSFTMKICEDGISVETENRLKNCFFRQYNIDSNYKMSACAINNNFPNDVIIKDCNELYDEILNNV